MLKASRSGQGAADGSRGRRLRRYRGSIELVKHIVILRI